MGFQIDHEAIKIHADMASHAEACPRSESLGDQFEKTAQPDSMGIFRYDSDHFLTVDQCGRVHDSNGVGVGRGSGPWGA